jgi:DNA invertase Pin-like site-specific DNA recombinase
MFRSARRIGIKVRRWGDYAKYALPKGWKCLEFRERNGRAGTRPVLTQMLYRSSLRRFDVVVVESVECFARSLAELSENVARLHRYGIRFVSVADNIDIDPGTEAGRSFLANLTVLAAAQTRMITCNVRAGLARAQNEGAGCGRPRRQFERGEAKKLRSQGLSVRAIAARLGIPASALADALKTPTVDKVLKRQRVYRKH